MIWAVLSRYKKCPPDKIMVVYGSVGKKDKKISASKCIHGGAAFVLPVFQGYSYLDLTPMPIDIQLTKALSKQNIRVDIPSTFTVSISTEEGIMENAAKSLLGRKSDEIKSIADEIIYGCLRSVIATMTIEEINSDREKFMGHVANSVETELAKIGLRLINVNIQDINDESGYIKALGQNASAEAVNKAMVAVAEKNRDGAVGKALAEQDQRIRVASAGADAVAGEKEADKRQRVAVAERNAEAVAGEKEADKRQRVAVAEKNAEAVKSENLAHIDVANSEANRRQKEAEAAKLAVSSEKVQAAEALTLAYAAEKTAEDARALKEKAKQNADVVVAAEIAKDKKVIEAEAEAEKKRREAKGEADGRFFNMDAEGRGAYSILKNTANGLEAIVKAANNDPTAAAKLLIVDKLVELTRIQVDAIKNIKIDKVTVWDKGSGENGKTSTADFLSGILKSVPALNDLFQQAGMSLPEMLGTSKKEELTPISAKKA
jgi:flotillin